MDTDNPAQLIPRKQFSAVMLWVGLFLTMIIGMIAKAIYDSALQNERIHLGWEMFVQQSVILPLLVSPMVFGAIYGYLRDSPNGLLTFIFAFQNGFFWKTVFGGIDKPSAFPH